MRPIDLPKTSSPRDASVLIAATSGRALARAARDAGYTPLVADFFADVDTRELAHACRKMPSAIARGFQWQSLAPALGGLAQDAPSPVCGLVYGAGFEDRPVLLDTIAERWPLLGNDAATVTAVKAPETFFAALDKLGIPHPATQTMRPENGNHWVTKRRGGAGGGHVSQDPQRQSAADLYYQEWVEGRAVAAFFVADNKEAHVLGFSEQWTAPAPGRPWRYGGAVRPASLPKGTAVGMDRAVQAVTQAFGLRGLGSADFIVTQHGFYLLEINPRPGATLDLYAHKDAPPLALHIDALLGRNLPPTRFANTDAAAAATVFASEALTIPSDMTWPAWVSDVPQLGERIDKQRPICTVLARAATAEDAKRLVETRKTDVLSTLQNKTAAVGGEQL